jgi:WD40 repeat protein
VSDSNKLINAWDWKSEKKSELSLCFHTGLVYDFIVGNKTVLSGGVDNKIVLADKVKMSRLLELQHHHKRGVLGVVTLNDHVVSVGGDLLTRMIKLNDRSEF